jgi:hypothetical protein
MRKWPVIFGLFMLMAIAPSQDLPAGTQTRGIAKREPSKKGQEQAQAQTNDQLAPKPRAASPEPAPPSCDEACQQGRENLQIQNRLTGFTGGLVVVGFLQVLLIAWQAALLAKTRGDVKRQADWIETQAGHMSRQTEILRDSVAAAKDGAKAAQEAIELAILRERAKVRIELAPLEVKHLGVHTWIASVAVNILNLGATKAFPIETSGVLALSRSSEKYTAKYVHPLITEAVIPATDKPIEATLLDSSAGQDTIWELNTDNRYAHVYGVIRYKDVFEKEHATSFRYTWRTNQWVLAAASILGGDPDGTKTLHGAWEQAQEDNEAT